MLWFRFVLKCTFGFYFHSVYTLYSHIFDVYKINMLFICFVLFLFLILI